MTAAAAIAPSELARIYAGMTPEQIAAHEDWVQRFKADQAVKLAEQSLRLNDEFEAAARRRIELLAMCDRDVVAAALEAAGCWDEADEDKALSVLRDAGFVRPRPIVPPGPLYVVEIVYRDGRENALLTPAQGVPRGEADSIVRTYRDSVTPEQGSVCVFTAGEA